MASGLVVVGVGEDNPGHALRGLQETLEQLPGTLLLCHVIDTGARGELGLTHGFGRTGAIRSPRPCGGEAERDAAAAILEEAAVDAPGSQTRVEEGEPGGSSVAASQARR